MRPNTMLSGILMTKRNRPVSTSMFTRMLVPKPKNAFQSPGVHNTGLNPAFAVAICLTPPLTGELKFPQYVAWLSGRLLRRRHGGEQLLGSGHPAENSA